MIHAEAWYREAGLEEDLSSLERDALAGNLDAIEQYWRLLERGGFPEGKITRKLIDVTPIEILERHITRRIIGRNPPEVLDEWFPSLLLQWGHQIWWANTEGLEEEAEDLENLEWEVFRSTEGEPMPLDTWGVNILKYLIAMLDKAHAPGGDVWEWADESQHPKRTFGSWGETADWEHGVTQDRFLMELVGPNAEKVMQLAWKASRG